MACISALNSAPRICHYLYTLGKGRKEPKSASLILRFLIGLAFLLQHQIRKTNNEEQFPYEVSKVRPQDFYKLFFHFFIRITLSIEILDIKFCLKIEIQEISPVQKSVRVFQFSCIAGQIFVRFFLDVLLKIKNVTF